MKVSPVAVGSFVLVILASCAQTPTEMSYFPEGTDSDEKRSVVWPSLPEVPRYRYTGQLLGEQNFGPSEGSDPGIGKTVFRWIVGLGAGFRSDPDVLTRPQSGMVEAGGRIIVTDVGRGALFVFDPLQGKLFIWDRADEGVAFSTPVGVTAGVDGEILVADAELHRVVRLSSDGKPLGSFGADSLRRPTGLVRDPATRRVYVADTRAHDIKVFDDNGTLLYRIGRHGSAAGEFNAPTHISLVKDRLYVTDTLNARVQILSMDGRPLKTIGKRGLYVGNLTRPKGVTVDKDGNVYVVESYYDHLLVFSQEGEFLLPIGGSGAEIGQFYLPAGAWSDDRGRLFVADMYNGRVVIFQYLGG